MAVKQIRVSDLSGHQAGGEQFAKLIVHEHPQYRLYATKRGERLVVLRFGESAT